MLSTIIILISGGLGFIWSLRARNPFTKVSSLLLSITSLLPLVPLALAQQFAPYAIALISLMAGFEPANSGRIRPFQKTYFGISGALFMIVALDRVITWPFALTLWPLVLLFLIATVLLLGQADKKKLRTRLGMIAVWCGMALNCLLSAL